MTSLRDRAFFRSKVTRLTRQFFEEREFLEVDVPTLVACPGMEPHLRAFAVAPIEASEVEGRWLHTSPEYAIKATLAELGTDVVTFARAFRDEPPTRWHHPEFTMVEWYRQNADYRELMVDCEALVAHLAAAFELEVHVPFRRTTVEDAFLRWVGVPATSSAPVLQSALQSAGVSVGDWDWDALFTVAYAECVEPNVCQDGPAFLFEFPAAMAALARLKADDPAVAERFELYLPGGSGSIELANAFGELVDSPEQRRRFESELLYRKARGLAEYAMPEAMLNGLAELGPTSGIALGFERLLVWLAEEALGWETCVSDWLLGEPVQPGQLK